MKRVLLLVSGLLILILTAVACGGDNAEVGSVLGETKENFVEGPHLRLQPGIGVASILVVDGDGQGGGYGFSFDNAEVAQGLPEGYFLPRKVEIYSIPTDANPRITIYRVILGPGLMPKTPDSVMHVTLSEEFWIGPLKPGLTQVLFR